MYNKSKIYNIYIKKDKNNNDKIEVIIDKINYKALFFGLFWFLYNKMWIKSLIIAIISIGLIFSNMIVIYIFFSVFIAINANSWKESQIKKINYQYIAAITEFNQINALRSYYTNS